MPAETLAFKQDRGRGPTLWGNPAHFTFQPGRNALHKFNPDSISLPFSASVFLSLLIVISRKASI